MRTPRGRCLSQSGWDYLGLTPPPSASQQLDLLSSIAMDQDDQG